MEWSDEGFVLASRRHGEANGIASLLTRQHGRHAGLVRGGFARRMRGVLQPGNRVAARWRARLDEHLGTMTCEPVTAWAACWLGDANRLAALASACALMQATLAEREPHSFLFDAFAELLGALNGKGWPVHYVRWEMTLLRELGFGLDLSRCAATGANDGLAFVSPKTGRAVSLSAGEPYRRKLLALPGFLAEPGRAADPREIAAGLDLFAFFLERHVLAPHGRRLPAARRRLAERFTHPADPAAAFRSAD